MCAASRLPATRGGRPGRVAATPGGESHLPKARRVGSFIAPHQLVVAHPYPRRQLELVAERGVGYEGRQGAR